MIQCSATTEEIPASRPIDASPPGVLLDQGAAPDLGKARFLGTTPPFDYFALSQGFCALPTLPPNAALPLEDRAEVLILFHETLPGLERSIQVYLEGLKAIHKARANLSRGYGSRTFQPLAQLGSLLPELRLALVQTYNYFPTCLGILDALGLCALALNRWPEGLFHLKKSAGLYQNPGEALLLLAQALKARGEEVQARSLLEKAHRIQRRTSIKTNLRSIGVHVLWDSPEVCELVRGVIQVGANVGDEVDAFCAIGISHQCYFEALPSAFEKLESRLASVDRERYQILSFPIALGNEIGTLPFFEGEHSGNSSFLDLSPHRSEAQQGNVHRRTIQVPVETLDHLVSTGRVPLENYNLLFMDVQGFEHEVILGARKSLEEIDFVVLEVSYTEIYEGNPLSHETQEFLGDLGFDRYKEAPGYYPEQGDAIYLRRGSKVARHLHLNLYS